MRADIRRSKGALVALSRVAIQRNRPRHAWPLHLMHPRPLVRHAPRHACTPARHALARTLQDEHRGGGGPKCGRFPTANEYTHLNFFCANSPHFSVGLLDGRHFRGYTCRLGVGWKKDAGMLPLGLWSLAPVRKCRDRLRELQPVCLCRLGVFFCVRLCIKIEHF